MSGPINVHSPGLALAGGFALKAPGRSRVFWLRGLRVFRCKGLLSSGFDSFRVWASGLEWIFVVQVFEVLGFVVFKVC